MKTAVIDMGTNTFNLLILDEEADMISYATKIPVGLGKGGFKNKMITPEAQRRAIKALHEFKIIAQNKGVKQVYTMATSAMRTAENSAELVKDIEEEVGFKVNVIDGESEARLIYKGVKRAVNFSPSPQLIIDIGGGSTEFVLASEEEAIWLKSFDLGSSRLFELFQPSDPITEEEIKRVEQHLIRKLAPLFEICKKYPPVGLIGSSGSFETLAAMILSKNTGHANLPATTEFTFEMAEYKAIAEKMIASTLEQRLATPGMVEMRAPLMGLVCILINLVIDQLEIKELKLSTYALKEGVFATLKDQEEKWLRSSL